MYNMEIPFNSKSRKLSDNEEPLRKISGKNSLLRNLGEEELEFIRQYVDTSAKTTRIVYTSSRFNLESFSPEDMKNVINILTINNIRYLNKFFIMVNSKLDIGGHFIGCVETFKQRKIRILNKRPRFITYPYYMLDFIFKRVFPKLKITKKLYYFFAGKSRRVLSLTETLGRLVSCGFEIINYKEINNLTYFAVRKVTSPVYNTSPSYGSIISLDRIGKGGKTIKVYKFRTMHPYAEFLQKFIYEQNKLQKGGKIKDDFRITNWGRVFRKLWIDELPMFYNFFKGDLKLVGIRPLTRHYLSLYRKDLVELRLKNKPGLIPPFYADMPKTLDGVMDSEERYLKEYEKNPIRTDIKYFFKATINIIFRRARSA